MSGPGSLKVAVVGLEFGSAFVPIYLEHPEVGEVGICDLNGDRLSEVGERLGIDHRYQDIDDILADASWDAVHIVSPVRTHADFSVKVLQANKHCACAVPMATSKQDIDRILEAENASTGRYMMMETQLFSREYFYVKAAYDAGELGELTFLRGVHMQDLDGYARYWWGYPPMHYITHAIAPLLALTGSVAEAVSCLGSGHLTDVLRAEYGNPFPLETAHFRLAGTDLAAEVTMAFFNTARPYIEGFSVYGDRRSFEWGQRDNDAQLIYEFAPSQPGQRGRRVETTVFVPPDRSELLPAEIARFTETTEYVAAKGRGSFTVRNDHGSSHPHLVHEFVSAVLQDRESALPGWRSANLIQPGISAHESALAEGALMRIPVRSPAP